MSEFEFSVHTSCASSKKDRAAFAGCFGKTPMQTFLDAMPMTNPIAQPGISCQIEFRLIQEISSTPHA